jgi:hypothetical protein
MQVMSQQGIYEGVIAAGLRLAETPENEGGWAEYFDESEGMGITDTYLRASTALMLENTKHALVSEWQCPRILDRKTGRWLVDETTRSALVGGFSDYLFPIIRAGFPTNPINDLVSVQPTSRRVATIVYWNWIIGRGKGSYTKGQRLFDANKGKQSSGFDFSNEQIDVEAITTLGGANATNSGVLALHSGGGIRPGSVRLTMTVTTGPTVIEFFDTGNGTFTAVGVTIASSSINYVTGAWSITLTLETFTTATTNFSTYRYDSEGSNETPQVDVQIVTSTAEVQRRAMLVNYSHESTQDILAEFGVSLEPQLVAGAAEQMNDEIAREIVREIWKVAPINSTFLKTGPMEFNQQDHFKDLVFNLNSASNNIQFRTRKGYGNWILCDEQACNIIESLPAGMFVSAPRPQNVQGIHFIGTLLGKFRVYKDLRLINEPGSSATGNILMGFKGTQFFEAGFVWAPYQLLYTTPTLQTADFLSQKGLASRYAMKMVNPDMYVRINIGA